MYCPKCGKSVTDGLRYCNHCGERLERESDDVGPAGKMLNEILETMFWTAILGLGILVGLVAVLLNRDVDTTVVAIVTLAYLATLFGICYTLSRQVPKLIDARLTSTENSNTASDPLVQFPVPNTAQLEAFREPATVTESTTKTLDDVFIERK